ncbi:hypothetical protein Nepgr_017547 [Nepenthes gracilis]|uniref:Protein RIK n=1 Tax=Nepenthes gracilis TaxID=150966 RepID=A0AAD3XTG5_NEPGR|nr:hypothetical protein Nepgr_017547 [Nepenthes gracilis]
MAEIKTQDFHSLKDEKAPIPSDMEEKSHQLLRRKKRKWDQPDESLFSAALAVPGILPINNLGSEGGVKLPGAAAASAGLLENPLMACYANLSHVIHTPIMQQQAAAVVQKLTQPKLQDELLIAREIVINDAEPTVRYKLTKRQTQEEIQKCTGAVVITRGRYHPPNIVLDGEKPLYLHISAGAHLKETAERIIAVDRAAAMVEEMLKQGHNLQTTSNLHSFASIGVKVSQPLSTCVYLGFDADPSLNIAARICGPNDHYINHIMNETGATVVLQGHGSGIHGPTHGEEGHQPLHLFLSSNNPKGLEDATLLAENLLDTISRECGITRVSPSEVYSAVPLPRDLLVGVQSSGNEPKSDFSSSASLISSVSSLTQAAPLCSISAPSVTSVVSYMPLTQPGGLLRPSPVPPNGISNFQSLSTSGTSYSGYAGIYPQATPLQQVALALRQSNPATLTISPSIAATGTVQKSNDSSSEKKRLPPKRKFQELSPSSRESASRQQVFSLTFCEANRLIMDLSVGSLCLTGFAVMRELGWRFVLETFGDQLE